MLSEQLKALIATAGVSRYAIAKATGVAESQLSRFLSGRAGLGLESIDKVGRFLGLRLVVAPESRTNEGM
jgi:transcriptional regulator with XRE-family HTH domain